MIVCLGIAKNSNGLLLYYPPQHSRASYISSSLEHSLSVLNEFMLVMVIGFARGNVTFRNN